MPRDRSDARFPAAWPDRDGARPVVALGAERPVSAGAADVARIHCATRRCGNGTCALSTRRPGAGSGDTVPRSRACGARAPGACLRRDAHAGISGAEAAGARAPVRRRRPVLRRATVDRLARVRHGSPSRCGRRSAGGARTRPCRWPMRPVTALRGMVPTFAGIGATQPRHATIGRFAY